jgi:hypothetical protein
LSYQPPAPENVVIVTLAAAALAATWTLTPKYPDGREVKSSTVVETTAVQTGTPTSNRQVVEARQVVRGGADGSATIEVTVSKFENDAADGSLDMGVLVGASYEMVLAADGTIRSVSGLDGAIREAIARSDLPEDQRQAAEATMLAMSGDSSVARSYGATNAILPRTPVGVGDQWTRDMIAPMPFGMSITFTYVCTLASVDGPLARVSCTVSGDADLDPEALARAVESMFPGASSAIPREVLAQQIAAAIQVKQASGSQNFIFDVERGIVVSSASEIAISVDAQGVPQSTLTKTNTRNLIVAGP